MTSFWTMGHKLSAGGASALFAAAALALAAPANADDVASFYAGKTITMTVGFGAGGGYDNVGRAVAQFIGKHIPGHPNVIVENMPGGGGIKAANWIYRQAPRDGTQIGVINQSAGLNQQLGFKAIKYDAAKFNYIGRVQIGYSQVITWHSSGIKTVDDARKHSVPLSATGAMGNMAVVPRILNRAVKTKFKIISGYKRARQAWLAMERGETKASGTSLGSLLTQTPTWLPEHKVYVIAQLGPDRPAAIPNAPLVQELATNDLDRKALNLFSTAASVGFGVMAPPGVPQARVTALRRAFDATLKDPEFQTLAKKTHMYLNPLSGEKVQKLVGGIMHAPKDVVARARQLGLP